MKYFFGEFKGDDSITKKPDMGTKETIDKMSTNAREAAQENADAGEKDKHQFANLMSKAQALTALSGGAQNLVGLPKQFAEYLPTS